jgi:3'-phosphoadenosine 5'-phosphosulfate sulfotransferase (PAPS reductase)/FAD synthetase
MSEPRRISEIIEEMRREGSLPTKPERTVKQFRQMQAWKIEHKIEHAIEVVSSFCYEKPDAVISFSGGKDSTVLMHLIRNVMKMDIPAVFVNTGNEYPEIVRFATKKYGNTTMIHPKRHMKQVIEKYGFPLISKEYSKMIYELRNGSEHASRYLTGRQMDGKETTFVLPKKYHYLIAAPFSCSDKCCAFLKKNPTRAFNSITGEMGDESILREKMWLRTGCNSFGQHSKSKPFSIWTQCDIWEYKRLFDVEFCDIYDDPRVMRTGCMFCGFGATFESISRFEIVRERYPKIYGYFLKIENGGVSYREALHACGVVLPDDAGYQRNIFSELREFKECKEFKVEQINHQ